MKEYQFSANDLVPVHECGWKMRYEMRSEPFYGNFKTDVVCKICQDKAVGEYYYDRRSIEFRGIISES